MAFDYEEMYNGATKELEDLHRATANVEELLARHRAKIDALTQTVNAIAPLIGKPTIPTAQDTFFTPPLPWLLKAAGITVAVRALFDAKLDQDLSAPMVRDGLEKEGWDWTNYSNPLSTIHAVIKRLLAAGAIKEFTGLISPITGKTYYSAKREILQNPLGSPLTGRIKVTDLMAQIGEKKK